MRIGLLGDVHGNLGWMTYALDKFHREGSTVIMQVGDLGIGQRPNDNLFLKRTRVLLENYGMVMIVAPGNHEDYDVIESIPVEEDGWQYLRKNILLAPRGHRWEMDGVKFVALGGAPSVDRSFRLQNKWGWWHQEAITEEDVRKTVRGGHADVMIAHDAPLNVPTIDRNIQGNPHGFRIWDLEYALEGRKLMDKAFMGVSPDVFIHGHYHFLVNDVVPVYDYETQRWDSPPESKPCHVLGLNKDMSNHSLGEYDTETREAKAWDIFMDYSQYRSGTLR